MSTNELNDGFVEPGAQEVQENTERVKARRQAVTMERITDMFARLRRLSESVTILVRQFTKATEVAKAFADRLEALEKTSCKFARTTGAACPSLGDRCEICEREAEAEVYKESVLGPTTYTPEQLALKCSIEHDAGCTCADRHLEVDFDNMRVRIVDARPTDVVEDEIEAEDALRKARDRDLPRDDER